MRKIMYGATALVAAGISVLSATPASAHGYISQPPSRQAFCAQRVVPNCGDIVYEPQSVEAPKGSRACNGGGTRFAVLNDDSKAWPATNVGNSVTFNWILTARHATSTWEYYIGNTRVAVFNDGGKQPGATVQHTVNLSGFSGRQKLLAVWNIADTINAFYNCVDLQIGGGGPSTPTPTPTVTPTRTPTPTPTPTTTASGTWAAGKAYKTGDVVTYNGVTYRCQQPHTAIQGWEPPNVPALWATA
ncbi:cellulose-binding protein [Sphaerisporangium siamense]|uniref:Chitin-binding protein n=1 Tax=Sphaerisporangium siamense TaxID=795645 RepID=A0A7W7GA83_9ACTN|nr:lytic polysaccharide monooxygenase [Sphaerisporangium siamense]MBB4701470.1 chitin-binding protein [Sphaerisporangium siamense]GII85593.1 cellulose-binding protein [Sphaerisporangium siamense]